MRSVFGLLLAGLAAFGCADADRAAAQPSDAALRTIEGLPHAQPVADFPRAEEGAPILQLGIGAAAWYGVEQPFANFARMNSIEPWKAFGGGKPVLDWIALVRAGHLDPVSGLPRALPAGYAYLHGPFVRGWATEMPGHVRETLVVEWEGAARLSLKVATPNRYARLVRPGRIEIDYPLTDRNIDQIGVEPAPDAPTLPDGAKAIDLRALRVFLKSEEAAARADAVSPRWKGYAGRYHVIRTMDLQDTNRNWTRLAEHVAPSSPLFLGLPPYQDAALPGYEGPRHIAFRTLFDLAVSADVALWMQVPDMTGTPDYFDEARIRNGDAVPNPPSIARAARDDWRAISASPEWAAMARRIVGDLEASAYPETRALYIGLGNEAWNWGGAFGRGTWYFEGLGLGMKGTLGQARYAYGWMSARLALEIERALADAGRRQAWTPVIESMMHSGGAAATRQALEGWRDFFLAEGLDPAPWLALAGVSAATYVNNGFSRETGLVAIRAGETYGQAFLRTVRTDPDFGRKIADWLINANWGESLTAVVARRKEHIDAAAAFGVRYVGDYEGGDHHLLDGLGMDDVRNEPDLINWIERWRRDEWPRVERARVEALHAQAPGAVIANYGSMSYGDLQGDAASDRTLEAPWADGYVYDGSSPTLRALEPFLRPRP